MPNALFFRKSSHSACAQRIPLIFRGKTSAAFPDVSIFLCKPEGYSVLNFARGQTPADDTCLLKCILKHRILRKIRATFLSLSEEKKASSAGLKRLRRSHHPLAYSLVLVLQFSDNMYPLSFSCHSVTMPILAMNLIREVIGTENAMANDAPAESLSQEVERYFSLLILFYLRSEDGQ